MLSRSEALRQEGLSVTGPGSPQLSQACLIGGLPYRTSWAGHCIAAKLRRAKTNSGSQTSISTVGVSVSVL